MPLQHPLFFDALQARSQSAAADDLHGQLSDFTFQFRHSTFRPAPLTLTRNGVARHLPELAHPAVQYVGAHLQPA
jgi:hypothetical protein